MKYYKVKDIAEALVMLEQGRKLILSKGSHYLQDQSHADEETWNAYLPADLRDELRGLRPELFERDTKEKAEISDKLLRFPNSPDDESAVKLTGLADTKKEPSLEIVRVPVDPAPQQLAESGTFIAPNDLILHDTARRILESVCVLEQLHTIKDIDRHELAFAFVGLDAKGNPVIFDKHKEKGDTLLSLADLAVYLLIDRYMKYQKADETIVSLNVEKTLLYNAYMQEKEKRKELEEAMMLKMLLKI